MSRRSPRESGALPRGEMAEQVRARSRGKHLRDLRGSLHPTRVPCPHREGGLLRGVPRHAAHLWLHTGLPSSQAGDSRPLRRPWAGEHTPGWGRDRGQLPGLLQPRRARGHGDIRLPHLPAAVQRFEVFGGQREAAEAEDGGRLATRCRRAGEPS